MAKVTIDEIETAYRRIGPHILRTPSIQADSLSKQLGHQVWLKLETLQPTGSFKLRGATNAMLSLDDHERARRVVTGGNHGPALALAASRVGVRTVICLSDLVPENKVANVRRHGVEPHIAGHDFDQSLIECQKNADKRAWTKNYLEQRTSNGPIRHELYAEIIYPILAEG